MQNKSPIKPATSGSVLGAGGGSFVSGHLVKTINGERYVFFETGDNNWSPFFLRFDTVPAPCSISGIANDYHYSAPSFVYTSGINTNNMVRKGWTIDIQGNAGPLKVTPVFSYFVLDVIGPALNTGYAIQKYSGGVWLDNAYASTNTNTGTYIGATGTTTSSVGIPWAKLPGEYIAEESLTPIVSKVNQLTRETAALNVFPNPNNGQFTVRLDAADEHEATGVITDVLGRRVKEFMIVTNKEVDVMLNEPPGTYILSVNGNGTHRSAQIVLR